MEKIYSELMVQKITYKTPACYLTHRKFYCIYTKIEYQIYFVQFCKLNLFTK